jgi:pyruvate oxidase
VASRARTGAWAAAPDRPIFAVTGDGGFAQYMAEVTTEVKHGMNITHVLLNNGQLGKITKEQRAGDWDVWQTTLHNPDFARYAQLCGALGIRVTERAELDAALRAAAGHDGPALVEVVADPDLI